MQASAESVLKKYEGMHYVRTNITHKDPVAFPLCIYFEYTHRKLEYLMSPIDNTFICVRKY